MLGCLHTQNGLTLHVFIYNGDPCEDCSEEKNIPILVYKGIGVVSVINIFLTLNIFSMSLGEAGRQYWPSQEIERGYLALRIEFTLVGDIVGSWQNQVLSQVFGMLIYPGLSWALGPQKGTWWYGVMVMVVLASVFSWPLHQLFPWVWVNEASHTIGYQDFFASLEYVPHVSPTGHTKCNFKACILPSWNTCPIFLNFESFLKPILRSVIWNSEGNIKFLSSFTLLWCLFQSKDWKGKE